MGNWPYCLWHSWILDITLRLGIPLVLVKRRWQPLTGWLMPHRGNCIGNIFVYIFHPFNRAKIVLITADLTANCCYWLVSSFSFRNESEMLFYTGHRTQRYQYNIPWTISFWRIFLAFLF